MAEDSRLICPSAALVNGGEGVRFTIQMDEGEVPAFAIRHHGKVYGYLNRCGHVPVEIDWQKGRFFDFTGLYLVCATHGALYAPESGRCLGGRCNGKGLVEVKLVESDSNVFLMESERASE